MIPEPKKEPSYFGWRDPLALVGEFYGVFPHKYESMRYNTVNVHFAEFV